MSQPHEPAAGRVVSPFSDAENSPRGRRRRGKSPIWIFVGLFVLLGLGVGAFFLTHYLNDPLRTLEPFPVGKYLENYKAVVGSRFRGDLQVENDLGWKEGVGRVMVFSLKNDPHPIVVMIPADLASLYFIKGQNYVAELGVKEGGLIYAYSCRKN
jgi:hypothetical protein